MIVYQQKLPWDLQAFIRPCGEVIPHNKQVCWRSSMNFITAFIVFVAYTKMGYYTLGQWRFAIKSYLEEQRRLDGQILTLTSRLGFPLGTMMVSIDRGQLPPDGMFPDEMARLRSQYGDSIAYCGKYAVWPGLEKLCLGDKVFKLAVYWACENDVDLAVMIVHPDHANYYRRKGAEIIARIGDTPGLKKAPAVLLAIKPKHSPRIQKAWAEEQERRLASQVKPNAIGQLAA